MHLRYSASTWPPLVTRASGRLAPARWPRLRGRRCPFSASTPTRSTSGPDGPGSARRSQLATATHPGRRGTPAPFLFPGNTTPGNQHSTSREHGIPEQGAEAMFALELTTTEEPWRGEALWRDGSALRGELVFLEE